MSRKPSLRRSEAGSAYIVALLVLVILTIVGLALTLVTQTEVNLGANERTITRTFYASDSGFAISTAKVNVYNQYTGQAFKLLNDSSLPTFEDRVTVTAMLPILNAYCNLCQVNTGRPYYNITHGANSTDGRTATASGGDLPLAQKRVGVMIEMQPAELLAAALGEITPADQASIVF